MRCPSLCLRVVVLTAIAAPIAAIVVGCCCRDVEVSRFLGLFELDREATNLEDPEVAAFLADQPDPLQFELTRDTFRLGDRLVTGITVRNASRRSLGSVTVTGPDQEGLADAWYNDGYVGNGDQLTVRLGLRSDDGSYRSVDLVFKLVEQYTDTIDDDPYGEAPANR